MKTISMLELRQKAGKLIRNLDRGESFVLTYRGRAVGEITPIKPQSRPSSNDPIYRLWELAEERPDRSRLSSRKADELIYG